MHNNSLVVEKLESSDTVTVLLNNVYSINSATHITPDSEDGVNARYTLPNLQPNTRYYVWARRNDHSVQQLCEFNTGPSPGTAKDFSFGWGTCTQIAHEPIPYEMPFEEEIAQKDLNFFAQLGDIHYDDVATHYPNANGQEAKDIFKRLWYQAIKNGRMESIMRKMPMPYMYDDHDYGHNDGSKTMRLREESLEFYHKWVPYVGLVEPGIHDPPYRRFDVGRLAFILMDQRSMADERNAPDGPNKTMLGTQQLNWLYNQMDDVKAKGLVMVMLNTRQWTIPQFKTGPHDQWKADGPNVPVTPDAWSGFSYERNQIANAIASKGIGYQTISLSGNLHRPCFDDGTNGDFSDSKQAPIPEALGSPMGTHVTPVNTSGYFTHGPFMPTNLTQTNHPGLVYTCGLVDVSDNGGNTLDLTIRLMRMSNRNEPFGLKEMFSYTWTAQIA